jgi:hypothetical protein
VPVSDIQPHRALIAIFLRPKPDLLPAGAVLLPRPRHAADPLRCPPQYVSVLHGEDVAAKVAAFVELWGLTQVRSELFRIVPNCFELSNCPELFRIVSNCVELFRIPTTRWGLTQPMAEKISAALAARVEARLKRRRILEMAVAAADGCVALPCALIAGTAMCVCQTTTTGLVGP